MNLNSLLDKIAGHHRQRVHERKADFQNLVRQVADGNEPDADYVDAVLADSGRSINDLRTAVEALAKRRQLRATVDRMPELLAQRKDIERRIAEADRAFEEADALHTETLAPLSAQFDQIKHEMSEAENAKRELERGCENEQLKTELAEIYAIRDDLSVQRSKIEQQASDLRAAARSNRNRLQLTQLREEKAELMERADDLEKRARQCDAEAAKLKRKIAEADRKADEVRIHMLEP